MSDSSSPDDLQFNVAEAADSQAPATAVQSCAVCQQPIASTYYAVGETILCPACVERVNAPAPGNPLTRLLKATFFGLGAGLIGALIWYAIRRVTNYEIGLVAVLVGFMVGKAVHVGSNGKGGVGYQLLAIVLTYCCIAANYMPDIFQAVMQNKGEVVEVDGDAAAVAVEEPNALAEGDAPADPIAAAEADAAVDVGAMAAEQGEPVAADEGPVGLGSRIVAWGLLAVFAFVMALALPFLEGAQNLIGLLIIGFALWEAWKFNARRKLPITGPYQIAAPSA